MRKNQVKNILIQSTNRKRIIFGMVGTTIILMILTLAMLLIYRTAGKVQAVSYNENSNIDYRVFLKDNEFFNSDYLVDDKGYIAILIDYIQAKFDYQLEFDRNDVNYQYTYWIEGNVVVRQKNMEKPLYESSDVLVNEKVMTGTKEPVTISENVQIDYNHYNQLIKNFIQIYGLENTESVLNVNLHVDVLGTCDELEKDPNRESVITLSIPLTTKTTAIDISNHLVGDEDGVIICGTKSNRQVFLVLGIVFGIAMISVGISTIRYSIRTSSLENLYESELKKILNHYSAYIQQLGSDFDFKDYQILKIDTFEDMLEIRDTIKQPILMKENEDKTGAYFLIPSNTKILYVYRIKIGDISE